jgi:hypothetical protein
MFSLLRNLSQGRQGGVDFLLIAAIVAVAGLSGLRAMVP